MAESPLSASTSLQLLENELLTSPMMNSASEKHKTQIDFSKLRFHPPLESGVVGKPIKGHTKEGYNNGNRANAKIGSVKTRKRSISPGGRGKTSTDLKPLRLPELVQSGIRAHQGLKTTHASPWGTYEKSYDVRLGTDDLFVTVAERRDAQSSTATRNHSLSSLALVRSFSGSNVEEKLRKLQQIQDISIVSPLEVFRVDEACYVVFEYMVYSLHYVTGSPRLDEIRLAAIVGQVRLSGAAATGEFTNCSRYLMGLCTSRRKVWSIVR